MPEEYKPNSDRSREREERKRPEKVISGNAKQKKKGGVAKLGDALLPGDAQSVQDYILMDVLIPSLKRMISDIVCNGINILLGEPNREKSGGRAAKVSYRDYYESRSDRRDYQRQRAQTPYSYDDIIFESRGDAEEVLYRMEELIDRFDVASVADLFDLAGMSSNYTDNKYGWTDLRSARVERTHDGYVIRLPRATTI